MTSAAADGVPPSGGFSSSSDTERARGRTRTESLRLGSVARRGIDVSENRWVFGTAASLGYRLGVTPASMRAAFVTLALAGGWGLPLYGIGWLYLNRSKPPTRIPQPSFERHIGLLMVTIGLLFGLQLVDVGFVSAVVWPSAAIAAIAAIAWGRGDQGEEVSFAIRLMAGTMIVFASVISMRFSQLGLGEVVSSLLFSGMMLSGLTMVLAPTLMRLRSELDEVRAERARTDERERMAAHLHDSVLQTLSLIQRHADSPEIGAQLARRQERELRSWLYDAPSDTGTLRVSPELTKIASEIEDHHGVAVEIVAVGDNVSAQQADASYEAIRALLAATREAILNAAKHAGTDRIDVFCEITQSQIEVFVRDTGKGFSADDVASDRHGIAQSIHARMQRVGGTAQVTSALGQGTEVELRAPLAPSTLDNADLDGSDVPLSPAPVEPSWDGRR